MTNGIRLLGLSVLALVASACGSGPTTFAVSGRVLFPDGQPLNVGTVEFSSTADATKGQAARGSIQPDGSFRLQPGAVAGLHQVIVTTPMPRDTVHDERRPPTLLIDPRYQDYARSGLTWTVTRDSEDVVLRVQKPNR